MYKIEYLPSSIEDLKKIQDWYSIEFSSSSALKVLDNILDSIDKLSLFPNLGSLPPDEVLAKLGYKLLIIKKKHIAIYKIIEKSVFIYHIANAKTDYRSLFSELKTER